MKESDAALVAAIPDQALRRIAGYGVIRHVKKGTVVFTEGAPGDGMFIIAQGKVEIYVSDEQGQKMIIASRSAGECFGEMSLEFGQRRTASITCVEPCVFAVVTRKTLLEVIQSDTEVAMYLISTLIRRSRLATELARDLALLDVYQRVAKALHGWAKPGPGGTLRIEERISQAEIARHVGAARDSVNKVFKALIEGSYLRIDDGRIVLLQGVLPSSFVEVTT